MANLRDRPTTDLVVIFLAGIVGVYVVLSLFAIFYLVVTHPDANLSASVRALSNVVSILVGAVVGYVAGRVTGNGNGNNNSSKEGK